MVEIWQANAAGRYAHPADDRAELALEDGFLGFGRSGHGRRRPLRVRHRQARPRAVARRRPAGAPPRGGRLRPRAAQARRHPPLLPRRGGGERRGSRARRRSTRRPARRSSPADEASTIAEACVRRRYELRKLLLEGRRIGNPAEPRMAVRPRRVGDEHVDWLLSRLRAETDVVPGPDHPLRLGRDLDAAGLDRRTRSCITLTALVALGHQTSSRCTCARRSATASPRTRSTRCCSRARSTAACPAANCAFAVAAARLTAGGGRRGGA